MYTSATNEIFNGFGLEVMDTMFKRLWNNLRKGPRAVDANIVLANAYRYNLDREVSGKY